MRSARYLLDAFQPAVAARFRRRFLAPTATRTTAWLRIGDDSKRGSQLALERLDSLWRRWFRIGLPAVELQQAKQALLRHAPAQTALPATTTR